METKIVYVLTSNEHDYLLEQLLMSLYTLKFYNPNSNVYLVVDQLTGDGIVGDRLKIKDYLTDIIIVHTPKNYNNMQRSRWIKTSLREYIDGNYLFLDSDTIITSSLQDCDNWNCDIAAVIDRHIKVDRNHRYYEYIRQKAKETEWVFSEEDSLYFNSGVMYVRDNDLTRRFYQSWHKSWISGLKNNVVQDQPTLAKTNKEFGYPIVELDGVWNCQIIANGLKYLSNARLIHYFNAERSHEQKSVVYLPSNRELYMDIRKSHFIFSDSIKEMLINGKNAFNVNYAIFADEQLKAIRDDFTVFVMEGFHARNSFYCFLRFIYELYMFIRRKFICKSN